VITTKNQRVNKLNLELFFKINIFFFLIDEDKKKPLKDESKSYLNNTPKTPKTPSNIKKNLKVEYSGKKTVNNN
jgi:hypothetical protein